MLIDPAIELALRGSLAALFLWACLHKARDVARFRAAFASYELVPPRAVRFAATALIGAELAVGLALLTPPLSSLAPLLAVALLALYSAAIGINLARGRRDIDCGCVGPASRQPLSEWLLARNGVLLALALWCLLPAAPRPLVWFDAVTIAGSVVALAALYGTANRLIANQPALARLRG